MDKFKLVSFMKVFKYAKLTKDHCLHTIHMKIAMLITCNMKLPIPTNLPPNYVQSEVDVQYNTFKF